MRSVRPLFIGLALAIVGTGVPAIAHESLVDYHLESGNRCTNCSGSPYFHWDFQFGVTRKGAVHSGTAAAFVDCMVLRVDGWDATPASYGPVTDHGFETATWSRNGIDVVRKVWVPEDGMDFARWVDSFQNSTVDDETVNVQYYCYYAGCAGGGFGGGEVDCTVGSSDGDDVSEEGDHWFAWNDADESGVPAVAVVTHGYGGEGPTNVAMGGWAGVTIDYRLDIPAGQTRSLLLYLVQANDDDAARSTADFLVTLPPDAVAGLDPLPSVVNFVTDGHPAVSPGGPYECPEGGEVLLEPWISDREGDPLEWAWDLDDDGVFEEDTLHAVFSAAGIDGPAETSVALHVAEVGGTNPVDASADVEIVNVAPILTSEPPRVARRGGLYAYTPVVVDPGTASGTEPMEYSLVTGEEAGIQVDASTGTVSWTPRHEHLGDHEVEILVEDDDGGEFTQSWTITVTDNEVPYPPAPLYPTLEDCVRVPNPTFKVSNATDLDEDRLTYFFEVDSWPGFDSVDLQRSPEEGLAEGVTGFTEWRVPRALEDGGAYYWRVWTSDGIETSERIVDLFRVCIDGEPPRVDSPPVDEGALCACATTRADPVGLGALLGALALLVRRRSLAGSDRRE